MIIGGLQKFSLLDYPGHLAAIIFTKGCNFRCQFCYNPMLVRPNEADKLQDTIENKKGYPEITTDDLFLFLQDRSGKLDAVVITGGEPTIHADLPEFIKKIRTLDYKIKLDTNGTNPDLLADMIAGGLIDYIAMDVKAPADKYDMVTGIQPNLNAINKSIKIIKDSSLPHEFRTTIVPELITTEDIRKFAKLIAGADKWYLQQFKPDTELLNESFEKISPYRSAVLEEMKRIAEEFVKECVIR